MENRTEKTPLAVVEASTSEVVVEEKPVVETVVPESVQEAEEEQRLEEKPVVQAETPESVKEGDCNPFSIKKITKIQAKEEQEPEEKPVVEAEAPEPILEVKKEQKMEEKADDDVKQNEEASKVEEKPPAVKEETQISNTAVMEPIIEEKIAETAPEIVAEATEPAENEETVLQKVEDKPPADPPASMHYIKIARIPKSVFDFMVKDEPEEGTVRLNLNQLKGFVNELINCNAHVNSAIWDTCPYPALDLTLPANTPNNCIVHNLATSRLQENEKQLAEKMQNIKMQEIARYAKMNDDQKWAAWREVIREYVKKDDQIQRLVPEKEKKKAKGNADVPSQIKPAKPLPGGGGGQKLDSANNGKASPATKSTSQAKLGQVDLSPAMKNENNRKRNQTNAAPEATANKKPKQDNSPQKAKTVTTPVVKKPQQPQQQQQQKRKSLPNLPNKQGKAGNKSFPKKSVQQQQRNYRQPDNRPKRFSDNYGERNRRSQETVTAANPWGTTPNPNIFGFITPAQDPMPGYHAYSYQNSGGATGMPTSMNPFAAPARDTYYDAHLADRERSMLERERRLLENYGGQQQQQHPYSHQQAYGGDREFRTTFDNYAAAREAPVFTRPEPTGYSAYAQDMNTSPYKSQQQPREYGRRY